MRDPTDTPPPGELFATAAKGTEGALRDELRELGFRGVRADRGGVHLAGSLDDALRACLELRTAVRVLQRVTDFEAPDGDALYDGMRSVDFGAWLTPRHTLAIRAACRSSALTHTQFIAQRAKDAIVDQLRERLGARPSVDLADPDVAFFVHLARDRATLYLDVSGEPLHRRGYRREMVEAPLKETLAAAVLRLAGWDRARPLLDPMCGSGTLAIEAALWSRRLAPGLARARFGVERWASHDEGARGRATALREQVRARALPAGPPILASDVDPAALAAAAACARAAGVTLELVQRSVSAVEPTCPAGHVVTNPPYGARLSASEELYEGMARGMGRLRGHRVSVLAGTPAVVRPFRARPESSFAVFNGDLECRLLTYEIGG